MKNLKTIAVVAFALAASTAMAKPKAGTLVMRIDKKTGQVSKAVVAQRLKPGTAIASLNFTNAAQKGEKAGVAVTANSELAGATSRSASLFFPGGLGYGGSASYYRASYSRQIYSSYGGGYYGGGGYTSPYTSNAFYPNYGGYGYRPYGYAEDDRYAYAYCGSGGYGQYGGGLDGGYGGGLDDNYGYDGAQYDNYGY